MNSKQKRETVEETPTRVELWQQLGDSDLWETESDLIVNTAALEERSAYFEVIRIPSAQSASETYTPISA